MENLNTFVFLQNMIFKSVLWLGFLVSESSNIDC